MRGFQLGILVGVLGAAGPVLAVVHEVPGEYGSIQTAINASAHGDTVLVQPGTYHESIDFFGKEILVGSHYVLSGDTTFIDQTVIDGIGSTVTLSSGETRDSRLSGFTITGGQAYRGGGIRCFNSSPTLDHLRIVANIAGFQGGGIDAEQGAPLVTECTISQNTAESYGGGGIACWMSEIVIDDNVVEGNHALEFGGGIYSDNSAPVIINNRILDNQASYGGCGIGSRDCTSIITDNYIAHNTGADYGGGLFY